MAIIKSKKRLPGIHPAYHKHTMDMETAMLPVPATVSIPMLQHIGAEAVPVVKPGSGFWPARRSETVMPRWACRYMQVFPEL